jgi:hypothetical protein
MKGHKNSIRTWLILVCAASVVVRMALAECEVDAECNSDRLHCIDRRCVCVSQLGVKGPPACKEITTVS